MILSPLARRALLVIAVILLLSLAWTGLAGGISQWSGAHSPGQVTQTVNELMSGVFALLSIVAAFWFRRGVSWMLAGLAIMVTLSAGLASVVYGGASVAIGFLSGGAALLVALGIGWMLQRGSRSKPSARLNI